MLNFTEPIGRLVRAGGASSSRHPKTVRTMMASRPSALDAGAGRMVVDRLDVLHVHRMAADTGIVRDHERDVAHQVAHALRVLAGARSRRKNVNSFPARPSSACRRSSILANAASGVDQSIAPCSDSSHAAKRDMRGPFRPAAETRTKPRVAGQARSSISNSGGKRLDRSWSGHDLVKTGPRQFLRLGPACNTSA